MSFSTPAFTAREPGIVCMGRDVVGPVDVLGESGECDAGVVIVKHVNVRTEYERVTRTTVLRQNYNNNHIAIDAVLLACATRQRCTAGSAPGTPCMMDSSSFGARRRLGHNATNTTQQGR